MVKVTELLLNVVKVDELKKLISSSQKASVGQSAWSSDCTDKNSYGGEIEPKPVVLQYWNKVSPIPRL